MVDEYDDFDNDDFDNDDIEENEENNKEIELDDEFAEDKMNTSFPPERRNSKRFDERLTAIIENEKCIVLNVSDKGVLLQTAMPVYFFPLSKTVEFKLQVEGEWVRILGKVMWIQSDVVHSKLGLFIQHAPETYFNFLRKLYE